jgi:hypothetical protein
VLGFCGGCGILVWCSKSGGGGNRTKHLIHYGTNTSDTEMQHISERFRHIKALPDVAAATHPHEPTHPEHAKDTYEHQKCAPCVPQLSPPLPDDLATVVEAWSRLPDTVKTGIVAMVKAVWQP